MDNIYKILSYAFSCSGRVNRKEFFIYYLTIWFLCFLSILPILLKEDPFNDDVSLTSILLILLCIIISLSSWFLIIRRLHDFNASGWWLLFIIFLPLIFPLFSLLFHLALFFIKGTNGANQYGDQP